MKMSNGSIFSAFEVCLQQFKTRHTFASLTPFLGPLYTAQKRPDIEIDEIQFELL